MALTYTQSRNLYGTLTKNTASANLSTGDTLINLYTRIYLRKLGIQAIERTETRTTTASQASAALPARMLKLKTVTLTSGTTKYLIKKSPTREHFDRMNENTSQTATPPEWYWIANGTIYFTPKISSAGDTLTFVFTISWRNNSLADYTTGTITSVANAGTAVVASGTAFHAGMVGRFLKITATDAANTGDEEWYEIASVTDATNLVLARPYAGTTIAAGSPALTIGQISPLPDGFHELPVYRAAQTYWAKEDNKRSKEFEGLADMLEEELMVTGQDDTEDPTLESDDDLPTNPNLQVTL